MLRFCAVAGLIISAFLVGRSHQPRLAHAAVVPVQPCKKYQCVNAHAWWAGNNAVTIKAVYWAVGGGFAVVAQLDTFNTFSVWNPPVQPPVFGPGTFEFDYPACMPLCPLIGLQWLAPQVVNQLGLPGPPPPIALPQVLCALTGYQEDGITPIPGPQSGDQSNQANPGIPPGVPSDTPAD